MKLIIVQGDITEQDTDAIVNAANSSLLGGGGVDGAIHRAAGPMLLEECKDIRRVKYKEGLPAGEAVITKGYELPAKFVIHTVGPIYDSKLNQLHLLKKCFINSLKIAEEQYLKSISFPAISTGVYGYPKEECARIMKKIFALFNFENIQEVRVVLYSKKDYDIFRQILEE
ncbi:MAG: O-acetyl-ADP-ribose deacetylase [Nanoarchaeota archaeon]|nr:O-acetyl-ADP-ribose deacetylase [Nanoarchaeota archaeon]